LAVSHGALVQASCGSSLSHGASCTPVCDMGYSVSGIHSCHLGTLTQAECLPNPCNASTPPTNGMVGNCSAALKHGSSCAPVCNMGYSMLQMSRCWLGELAAASCSPSGCAVPEAPLHGGMGDCAVMAHGGSCVPTCSAGYNLVGGSTNCSYGELSLARCEPIGEWTESVCSCF